ncbi:MAG: hypothetical protein KYX64_06100 [Sphingopyxis sp.]|nr:hypothetical protein [Sphingopyxis sp.]
MTLRRIVMAVGAAALMQPPVVGEARVLTIPVCGGGVNRIIIPGDPADPGGRGDCAKACHAITERRTKTGSDKKRCC